MTGIFDAAIFDGAIFDTGTAPVVVVDTHDGAGQIRRVKEPWREKRDADRLAELQGLRAELEAAFNPESVPESKLAVVEKAEAASAKIFDINDELTRTHALLEIQQIRALIRRYQEELQDEEDIEALLMMGIL